ncbi:MAG: hypothetical protein WCL32_22780, partial [Planctomycetota bacterium]
VGQFAELLDPGQKRILAVVVPRLKNLNADPKLAIIQEPEAFAGCKFRLGYRVDWGPTSIEILEGQRIDRGTLLQLADSLTLFMDYHVFPAAEKKQGDEWNVDISRLGMLIPTSSKYKALGDLRLKLDKLDDKAKIAHLRVVQGAGSMIGLRPKVREKFDFAIKDGKVEFATDQYFVKEARLEFDFKGNIASLDHLFLPMESVNDVTIQSLYIGELQEPAVRKN